MIFFITVLGAKSGPVFEASNWGLGIGDFAAEGVGLRLHCLQRCWIEGSGLRAEGSDVSLRFRVWGHMAPFQDAPSAVWKRPVDPQLVILQVLGGCGVRV